MSPKQNSRRITPYNRQIREKTFTPINTSPRKDSKIFFFVFQGRSDSFLLGQRSSKPSNSPRNRRIPGHQLTCSLSLPGRSTLKCPTWKHGPNGFSISRQHSKIFTLLATSATASRNRFATSSVRHESTKHSTARHQHRASCKRKFRRSSRRTERRPRHFVSSSSRIDLEFASHSASK